MIVVWRVTAQCNLHCGFCAYAQELPLERRESDTDAVLAFAHILSEYQSVTGQRVMVSWLGGEPFLWKPISKLSVVLTQELGLRVSATTNGTALKVRAARQLVADHFDELTISIDGPKSFHDRIRGWPGGFDELHDGILKLKSMAQRNGRELRLRVNTVLMAENIDLFASLCEELVSWDIDEITFNQLGGNDRPEFHREQRLSVNDIDRLGRALPQLRLQLQERGVRLAGGEHYLRRFRASAEGVTLPISDCDPARDFLFIDEHGRIAPCSFTVPEYAVNIREIESVGDLHRLQERFSRARVGAPSRWCEDCPSTRVFEKFVA